MKHKLLFHHTKSLWILQLYMTFPRDKLAKSPYIQTRWSCVVQVEINHSGLLVSINQNKSTGLWDSIWEKETGQLQSKHSTQEERKCQTNLNRSSPIISIFKHNGPAESIKRLTGDRPSRKYKHNKQWQNEWKTGEFKVEWSSVSDPRANCTLLHDLKRLLGR